MPIPEAPAEAAGAEQGDHYLRAMLESAMDMVVVLDAQGTIRYGSPAVRRVLGYRRGDLEGRPVFEVIHPDDAGEMHDAMRRVLVSANAETSVEARVRHRDGEWRWIEAVARNLVADPVVGGVVLAARDTTDRRHVAEALEASDQRFRLAFESSPIAMFLSTPLGRVTRANGAFADLLGYSPEEIDEIGWDAITHADDRARCTELAGRLASGELSECQIEARYRRKNGRMVWLLLTASLVRDRVTGAPSYVFANLQDIGDRKRVEEMLRATEERFKLLGRATRDLVYDWDMTTGVLEWSETLFTIFGHDAEAFRPDVTWWEAQIHPDDYARVAATLQEALDGDAVSWSDEYRFRRGDESWAVVHDRGYIVRGDDGRALRMIGAMADITDRKDLEAHLRQAQKMDAIGRLAGGIAHDFNNLLTVISSNCELILSDIGSEGTTASDVEEIRDAAARAAALTRQLLAFSRRQVMQLAVVDVNDAIIDMEKMLRRVIGEEVELHTHLGAAVALVRADRNQLEQVLLNLTVNARDAMPHGGLVRIETLDVDVDAAMARRQAGFRAGAYVEIRVTDTGVGMSPDVMARLFEPFFTTKDVGKGTGLGLSTVYGIVKQSHGFVFVDSTPAQGSVFHVYLPRLSDELADGEVDVAPRTGGGFSRFGSGRTTVLLVEDEGLVRSVVRRTLERGGYQVLEARTAIEALELGERYGEEIDAVLSDVVMPGMNGHALAGELRARRPSLPVILMSGYADEYGTDEDGRDAVLRKPVQAGPLLERLQKLVEARRRSY